MSRFRVKLNYTPAFGMSVNTVRERVRTGVNTAEARPCRACCIYKEYPGRTFPPSWTLRASKDSFG